MNHLKCKYCGCIFDADLKRCPDCGTKVKRREADQYYTGPLDLKAVATACSFPEKDIICSILDSEQIPYLLDFPEGGVSSIFGDQSTLIHIQVKEVDFAKAEELLSQALQETEEIDWDSIDVGEPSDENL